VRTAHRRESAGDQRRACRRGPARTSGVGEPPRDRDERLRPAGGRSQSVHLLSPEASRPGRPARLPEEGGAAARGRVTMPTFRITIRYAAPRQQYHVMDLSANSLREAMRMAAEEYPD